MLSPKLQLLVSTVARLLRRRATASLSKVLSKQRAEDVAVILRHVPPGEWSPILDTCPDDEFRAEVLSEADTEAAARIVSHMEAPRAVDLLHLMDPDDVADILGELDDELQAKLLALLHADHGEDVEELLAYGEETAGGIMNPVFFSLHREVTAQRAIEELRGAEKIEMVFYVYVVSDEDQLVGVVSLRDLVTTAPDTTLDHLMVSDVITVNPEMDQEEVARLASRYGFLAIPVVDEHHKLLGIVTIDDVIDVIKEEATEDILRMAGAHEDLLDPNSPPLRHVRSRVLPLLATAIGGMVGASLLGAFQMDLQAILPLAFFVPIVLGMGGNVGTQSSTIVVRGLALGRIDTRHLARLLARQAVVGVALGLIYGAAVALFSALWFRGGGGDWNALQLGVVVGSAVLGQMTIAALVGSLIPILMERLHIDPAVATGPFVSTTMDMLGIVVYFSIARLILPL